MVKAVWGFPLALGKVKQKVEMPIGAKPLCIRMEKETPHMYALVSPKALKQERLVHIFKTGEAVSDEGVYVDTFMMYDSTFHVFVKP